MGIVTVRLNNRTYRLGCGAGEQGVSGGRAHAFADAIGEPQEARARGARRKREERLRYRGESIACDHHR